MLRPVFSFTITNKNENLANPPISILKYLTGTPKDIPARRKSWRGGRGDSQTPRQSDRVCTPSIRMTPLGRSRGRGVRGTPSPSVGRGRGTPRTPMTPTATVVSTPATTHSIPMSTPGSGRGRGQKRARGRGGPRRARARRQLHGPDDVPEWIRDRAPDEVFVHEIKLDPSDKNYERKKWEKPLRRWFDKDQGKVGSKVIEWDNCSDNLYHSETVQGVKNMLDCFKLFLTDEFIQNTVTESKKYAQQTNQPRKGEKVTVDSVWATMGIILLSGYNSVPNRRMYWAQKPDLYNALVANAIRRDTCEDVLSVLHFIDNTQIHDGTDKFRKVRVSKI